MADETRRVAVELVFGASGAPETQAAMKKMLAQLEQANKESAELTRNAQRAEDSLKKLSADQRLVQQIKGGEVSAQKLANAMHNITTEQQRLFRESKWQEEQQEIERANKAADEYRRTIEGLGDTANASADTMRQAFRNTRRDIEDDIAGFEKLIDQRRAEGGGGRTRRRDNVIQAIGRALPGGAIPGTNLSFQEITTGLSAFSPIAAGATIAAIGLTAAVEEMGRQFENSKRAAQAALDLEAQLALLRKSGTKTDFEEQIEQARLDFQTKNAAVSAAENFIDNFLAGIDSASTREDARNVINQAVQRGGTEGLPLFIQGDRAGLEAAIETLAKAGPEAEQALLWLTSLQNTMKDSGLQARFASEALEEANRKQQAITDQRIQATLAAELAVANMSGEAIQERLDWINREQAAILSTARAGEIGDEALANLTQRTRDLAAESDVLARALGPALAQDALKALTDLDTKTLALQEQHNTRMLALREQGNKQLENAEKQLRKSVEALAKFEAAQQDKQDKASADFMSKELERTRKFNKDIERAKEDSNRRLLQLGQQLEDKQLEATLSNDTGAFLRAQREFDRAAEVEKENLDISSRRKLEDFQEESRRNQQLLTEKLAAIDTERDARRAELQEAITEREASLEAVKKEIADKEAAEIASHRRALSDMVKTFDTSTQAMTGISQQAMAVLQQAGVNVAGGIVDELQRRANLLGASSGQYSTPSSITRTATGVTPTVRVIGFAEGTMDTRAIFGHRPSLAVVNDTSPDKSEAIVPYRRSVGLVAELQRMGISGGPTYHFFEGATLGSGVTHAELKYVKDVIITAISMAEHAAVTGIAP